MANQKSKARAQAQQRARAQAKKAAARTVPSVRATPSSPARPATRPAAAAAKPVPEVSEPSEVTTPDGPPTWFQWTTLLLALIGLGISVYETWAHYNGNKLLGCSSSTHATFDCSAVITSAQSMVFGIFPVAVLGLAFYVVAVPLFSPWGWRFSGRGRVTQREVSWLRLVSMIVGMGFVMYLIYAEVAQIKNICEYCTGVHIVTFVLFCMTVLSAAWWGLGQRRGSGDGRDAAS